MPELRKKIHVKTYGCQMNVYDSGRMAELMEPHGYESVDSPEEADLVVLNTCHIREKAEEKVFSDLGRLRNMREARRGQGKDMLIAVGGCVGQAEGDFIRKRAPYVSMVFGPQSYHKLPEMVRAAEREEISIDLDFAPVPKFDSLPLPGKVEGASAFLSIQEGCDKFCTFCVVPYTRGAEYSREAAKIMAEARQLVSLGAAEITLLGQNVNAFHGEGPDGKVWGLGRLIRELAEIDGLKRIRYTTSHPRDMDDELIAAHAEVPALMPYLHLPVQSGSDRILKAMNRKHTAAHYIGIVERLRAARPDIALSSDFITGFPGETDADFEDTMRLVETIGYASAFSFKYSPRPGTPGADMDCQIDEAVKTERLARLQELLGRQMIDFNRRTVGMTVPVLFEKDGKLPGQKIGKSPYLQSVHVVDPALSIGDLRMVTLINAGPNSMTGELTKEGTTHAA